MQLWVAAVFFIVCVSAAAISIKLYGKSKKARFIVLMVIVSLFAVALLAYAGLTIILLGGVHDTPSSAAIVADAFSC